MIQEVGNIELCELLETDPKTRCTACLFILEGRHRQLNMYIFFAGRNKGQSIVFMYTMDFL